MDLAAALASLSLQESNHILALNTLVSDRSPLDDAVAHLQHVSHRIDHLCAQIDGHDGLVERVERVYATSERVGNKVRKLDLEIGHVKQAVDVVTEVMELKNALQQCAISIDKSDWEAACRACKRAMSIRTDVLHGAFAEAVLPTPAQPLPPPQHLAELRTTLLDTFRREFDDAASRRDQHAVSRFFRLWPDIDAQDQGLEAYGQFVISLVKANHAARTPAHYIAHLTSLLESIAHIIDQHQPVVEKYYGAGRMATVVNLLVGESDRVVRSLVEGWEEERHVGRLITETTRSTFPLLAQPSLLPPLFPPTGTPQLSSIAPISSATSLLQSYGPKRPQAPERAETPVDDGPDPRDIDRVLGELVALGGRWALFRRFVHGRVDDADILSSGSHRAILNLLRVYYEPLELWFLRMSVEKAHRLDTPDTSSRPHVSSLVDDVFYLLKLVLGRLLSCGSLPTLTSMRARLVDLVERDYCATIKARMDSVGDNARALIIYINDLDLSADYMDRMITETPPPQVFLPDDIPEVVAELSKLGETSSRLRSTAKSGIEQLFNQLIRPRLRAVLDECYKDVTYLLDEESFAEADDLDVVRKRFARAWENLLGTYKDSFTDTNYQLFFGLTADTIIRPWEKMAMAMRFTELGAIRFERDVRGVMNYLSTHMTFGGVREKFTRLLQIANVLNMDDEDPEDYYSNAGIPWRISKTEFNAVLEQRV